MSSPNKNVLVTSDNVINFILILLCDAPHAQRRRNRRSHVVRIVHIVHSQRYGQDVLFAVLCFLHLMGDFTSCPD
jgi:hypothetical protein